ncbi:MAG: CPBP family intramembrane metalloprotease [Prevotella sp.]|nr:CPBP family intramembrane metalloprotease [Prevotella sp.]
MKKALIYVVAFVLFQLVAGGLMRGVWIIWKRDTSANDPNMMVATMALFSLVTLIVFLYYKWAELSPNWLRTRPWTVLCWCVLAALGALIPSAFLQEQLPELPNWAEEGLDSIMRSRVGYLAVGLLAPFAEEVVFRGAILRALLAWKPERHWMAIVISALLFALVHMNPAQMPHALLVGLLLGWMYFRTNSIIPGVTYHWVNNSVAYVLYHLYPDPTLKLVDIFGGNQQAVLMAVGFSLCILLPSIYQLNLKMKR